MEINLAFRRDDFKEMYFVDGRGSYIRDESIKTVFRNLMIMIAAVISLFFYSYLNGNYDLFQISLIILGVFVFVYFDRAIAIRGWRKKIEVYLDSQEVFSKNTLIVTDSYFSLVQDTEENFEKWSNLNKAKISDKGIWLFGMERYVIPAKSMRHEEYEEFRKIVSEKLK